MKATKPIHVDQFVVGFSPYDAISNEALLMQKYLRDLGYKSEIYAEHIHPKAESIANDFKSYQCNVNFTQIAIYHFSIGSALTAFLGSQSARIILRYHNITPPAFFSLISDQMAEQASILGETQISALNQLSELVLADSPYNLKDFTSSASPRGLTLPILRDYSRLVNLERDDKLEQYIKSSGRQHWLFVGRIAPNKSQQDLIIGLKAYQETIDSDTRLVLIGSFFSADFKKMLMNLCQELDLSVAIGLDNATEQTDVLFLPGITDEMLNTAYKSCDLFLCLSEHEGFCVPLFEAIAAKIPIVAYNSSAIAYIDCLEDNVIDSKDLITVINKIQEVLSSKGPAPHEHPKWKDYLLGSTEAIFKSIVQEFVGG